jgi:hypothetical protein
MYNSLHISTEKIPTSAAFYFSCYHISRLGFQYSNTLAYLTRKHARTSTVAKVFLPAIALSIFAANINRVKVGILQFSSEHLTIISLVWSTFFQ